MRESSSPRPSVAGAPPRAKPGSRPGGPSPQPPEAPLGDTLVHDGVSLLDSVVEYLASYVRLERYRFEVRTRRFVQKALAIASGALLCMAGLVFASVGVSSLLSEWLQVPYAGPLIVGGFYLLVGFVVIAVVGRKKEA